MSVRWGFLGAGGIARTALAPAVHAARNAVLQAVAARDPQRGALLSPHGRAHGAYAELLDDDDVDAVYISLPNDAHRRWTVAALEAGKHVLCEKPLGLDADEVAQMAAAAQRSGRLLVEASWNRWHPRTRRAEALVASGWLGEVRETWTGFATPGIPEANYRARPEMGGGALYDVGCYAVAAALLLHGWRAPTVGSVAVRRTSSGVDESTEARLLLGQGRTATVACGIVGGLREWVVAEGSEARLELVEQAFTSKYAASTLTIGSAVETFPPVDPYQLMVEAVSARIEGEDAFVVPLEQSVAVAAALDAVRAAPEGAVPDRA